MPASSPIHERSPDRAGALLRQLLALETTDLRSMWQQAAQVTPEAFGAEQADMYLFDPGSHTLVAVGTSDTSLGSDRLLLAAGGRLAWVFTHRLPYRSGQVADDPLALSDRARELGVRSLLAQPWSVAGEVRGVVAVCSVQPDHFTADDLELLGSIAHWIELVTHRSELAEQLAQHAAAQARRTTAEELLTTLAHDLRHYLTPLQVWLRILQPRLTRSPELGSLPGLDEVVVGMDRVLVLVNDLLDVARLEHGLFTVTPAPLDLTALIAELCTALHTPERAIELRAPSSLPLVGDADRLRQALHNLLVNALDHSPVGEPVQVTVETVDLEGQREAVVTVANDGDGIPPAFLPHVFERFARGEASTGLGIGLYLAERMVTAHGGTLTVDSAPAQGARFRMGLPLTERSPAPRNPGEA